MRPARTYSNVIFGDRSDRHCGFFLEQIRGIWRTVTPNRDSIWIARGTYIFVLANRGLVVARRTIGTGHIDLVAGRPVYYAGEIHFSGGNHPGNIFWWNNRSGHYLPEPDEAMMVGLPLELFRAWNA